MVQISIDRFGYLCYTVVDDRNGYLERGATMEKFLALSNEKQDTIRNAAPTRLWPVSQNMDMKKRRSMILR